MTTNAAASGLVDQIVVAYNTHDIAILRRLYHDDVTYWSALEGTNKGKAAVISHIEHLHQILPDEKMRAKTVTADDEMIVVEFESTGTGPNGREYRIEFTEVFEVVDTQIVSIKVYLDTDAVASISM